MAPFAQMMMQLPRRRKSSRPKTPPSPQSFRSAHPSPFIKQPDVLDITVPVASPPSRPPLPIPGPVPDSDTTTNSQPADTQQQQPQNEDPASPESLSSPLHTFSLRPELGELDFSTTGSLSDSLADWFGTSSISLGATTTAPKPTEPTPSEPPALPKPSAPFANPAISQSTDSLALPRRFEQQSTSNLRPARSNESLIPSTATESSAPLSSSIGSMANGMMSATSIAYTIATPITGHVSIPSNSSFRAGTPQTNSVSNGSSSHVPSTPVLTATPLTSTISLVTSTPKTAASHSNWPSEKQAGPSRERFNAPLPPLPPGAPSPPQESPVSPRRAPPAPIVIPQPQQSHTHYLFLDEDPEAGSSHQLPNGRPPSYRTIASPKHRPVRDSEFPNDYMMLSPGFTLNVDRGSGYVPLARQDSATLPLNSPLDGGLFGDEPRPSRPQLLRMRSAAAHVESNDGPSTKLLSPEDKAELKRSRSAAPGEASTSSSANMRVLGRRRQSDAASPDEPEQSSPPLMPPVPSFTRPRQNSAPRRPIPMIPPPLTIETRPSAEGSLPRPSTSDSGASKAAGSSLSSHHSPAQSTSSANSQLNNRSSTEPPLAQYLDIFSPSDGPGHSPVSSSIPSPQSGRHSPSSIKFNHPPRPNLSPAEHTRATTSPRSPLQLSDGIPRSPSANSTTSSRSHANRGDSSDMLASMVMFDPDQLQTARQQPPRESLMTSPALSPAPSPKAMRRRSGTMPSHMPSGRIPLTLNPRTRPPRPSQFPHTPASALVSPSIDLPFDKERAPDVPQPATAHSVFSMLPPPVPPPISALPALPQITPPSPPQVSTPTSSISRAPRPPLPIGPRKPSTRPKPIDQGAARVATTPRPEAAPSTPRFETIQVPWRGLTIEAAKWTFSSNQLQEIVRRAIRQSAESSSIRLLQPTTIDEELPAQMLRLEARREEIQAKYKAQVKRRRVLIRSLGMYMDGSDAATAGRLMEELSEVTTSCDQLCEELHFVTDQVAQINKLLDGHSASALAMALRKINTSFLRVTGEAVDLRNRVAALEAEKEEGWAVAQVVAQAIEKEGASSSTDADDSRTPITPGTGGSSWSNRVSAARKTSIRASKASLRSYRSHRSSNASFKYNSTLTPSSVLDHGDIPPVPPMPTRAMSTRSGGGEVSYHPYANNHSGASRPVSMMTDGGGGSPISPGRALAIAQAELLEMLGITPADLKEAKFPSRPVGRGRSYSDAHTPAASPPMSPIDAMMPPPSPRPPTVPKLTRSASDHVVAKRRTGANLEVYAAHHVSHVDALYEGIMEDPETLFAILDPHQPRTRF